MKFSVSGNCMEQKCKISIRKTLIPQLIKINNFSCKLFDTGSENPSKVTVKKLTSYLVNLSAIGLQPY